MGDNADITPKRKAIVDRLRQRIELYRKRHVDCMNRQDHLQRSQEECERQETAFLQQRMLENRMKNTKLKNKGDTNKLSSTKADLPNGHEKSTTNAILQQQILKRKMDQTLNSVGPPMGDDSETLNCIDDSSEPSAKFTRSTGDSNDLNSTQAALSNMLSQEQINLQSTQQGSNAMSACHEPYHEHFQSSSQEKNSQGFNTQNESQGVNRVSSPLASARNEPSVDLNSSTQPAAIQTQILKQENPTPVSTCNGGNTGTNSGNLNEILPNGVSRYENEENLIDKILKNLATNTPTQTSVNRSTGNPELNDQIEDFERVLMSVRKQAEDQGTTKEGGESVASLLSPGTVAAQQSHTNQQQQQTLSPQQSQPAKQQQPPQKPPSKPPQQTPPQPKQTKQSKKQQSSVQPPQPTRQIQPPSASLPRTQEQISLTHSHGQNQQSAAHQNIQFLLQQRRRVQLAQMSQTQLESMGFTGDQANSQKQLEQQQRLQYFQQLRQSQMLRAQQMSNQQQHQISPVSPHYGQPPQFPAHLQVQQQQRIYDGHTTMTPTTPQSPFSPGGTVQYPGMMPGQNRSPQEMMQSYGFPQDADESQVFRYRQQLQQQQYQNQVGQSRVPNFSQPQTSSYQSSPQQASIQLGTPSYNTASEIQQSQFYQQQHSQQQQQALQHMQNPAYQQQGYYQQQMSGYPQSGHPQTGHPQVPHPQSVHPQAGIPQGGLPQTAHPQAGHPQAVHPQAGHPQTGHPQAGHPQAAHPQAGHPQTAHRQGGHPQAGQVSYSYQQPNAQTLQQQYQRQRSTSQSSEFSNDMNFMDPSSSSFPQQNPSQALLQARANMGQQYSAEMQGSLNSVGGMGNHMQIGSPTTTTRPMPNDMHSGTLQRMPLQHMTAQQQQQVQLSRQQQARYHQAQSAPAVQNLQRQLSQSSYPGFQGEMMSPVTEVPPNTTVPPAAVPVTASQYMPYSPMGNVEKTSAENPLFAGARTNTSAGVNPRNTLGLINNFFGDSNSGGGAGGPGQQATSDFEAVLASPPENFDLFSEILNGQ